MQLNELQQHILKLASLAESTDPVVNCYLNVNAEYHKAVFALTGLGKNLGVNS